MPKNIISPDDRQEIRSALAGLAGARAKQAAQQYASLLNCHVSRIYEITKDLRPARKPRADKGKRRADLLQHEGLKFVTECVLVKRLDPDLAIETAEANGFNVPVSEGTVRRYLRERGLDRRQRRSPIHAFRSWEAKAPLEIFQFDITGLKERWYEDVRTRRILHLSDLDVSTNHPNENRNRVKLWSFHLCDDYSRVRYVRFVAVDKPNSCHVIEFLLECFRVLGVPLVLYTDNDPIIVSRRMARASDILNRAFAESGGFRLAQHTPGRPQATGKVETGHRIVEKFWNSIGLKLETPRLADLNRYAANVCDRYSRVPNRATGIAPLLRFNEGHQAKRIPPPALLDSAFKASTYTVAVSGDLTISIEKVRYQLPRREQLGRLPNPFLLLAGRRGSKIEVVWPPDADYFVAIVDGMQYELDRVVAQSDAAGEFRTLPESAAQQTMKAARASHAERRRAHKEAGTEIVVPGMDVPFAAAGVSEQTAIFPRKEINPSLAQWANVAPEAVAPSVVDGQLVNRWTAAEQLQAEELLPTPLSSRDKDWLDKVFAGRDEMAIGELREALATRVEEPARIVEIRSA